jgi:uncharacterized protein (DUF2235 family)
MTKNIVICLDGTNNKLRAAANTNVVRLFDLLDLSNASEQVAYYDPGVGTFSSPAAWTPVARTISRYAGLMFGVGLRQNLGEAYCYLMSVYEPGDRLFIFGFSRGAYTARALTGMLEVFGILRSGAENLVPYAVSEYAKQEKRKGQRDWKVLREYARIYGRDLGLRHKDHAPIHFLGVWDTVKAAGLAGRQLRWPYTRQLPHVETVRHAVSIDEKRRPFVEYLVHMPESRHLIPPRQDLLEVWFAGVHSDVGGTFEEGARLSDIPLKWMAEHAVVAGLLVRKSAYNRASQVTDAEATGAIHVMSRFWSLLGVHRRTIPAGANIHASVELRIKADPTCAKRLPAQHVFVDQAWREPKP